VAMKPRLLVFGQFGAIAVLLAGGSWLLPWWGWVFFVSGLALFAWAASSLGANNFTIMPLPREGNTLSNQGIYRFLRHPMYTSVLLCGVAVSFGAPSLLRWIALTVCAVVLVLKIRFEEQAITGQHPDYPERMKGVARLVPGIW
jgi:protein-S-isoprenylcysteine O-methyltransferase Ste14